MAYPEVTAETVDGYINTALGYIESGNYVEARRYVTLAQVAKKALYRSQSEDGKSAEWDAEIRDVLQAINELESSDVKSSAHSRLIKSRVARG